MSRQASRIPKRLASGLVAVALATSGLALALGSAPAGATATVTAKLLGGSNTVILSTGENFPDALSGSSVAGAYPGAMLLSPGAALAPETINALGTLHATHVVTLGGSAALSSRKSS